MTDTTDLYPLILLFFWLEAEKNWLSPFFIFSLSFLFSLTTMQVATC